MEQKHTLRSGLSLLFFLLLVTYSYGQQTQTDSYTRYELLSPESQKFRIIYDVSATTTGATYYWNTLRKGSEHEIDQVIDLYSGIDLNWSIVSGTEAKKNGHVRAQDDGEYLQVQLARPVPEGGETRLRIDKTYEDPKSYFSEGETIIFDRTLGITRNAIVLPEGYEISACNYPSQVEREEDGRIKVSFMHEGLSAIPSRVEAKPVELADLRKEEHPWPDYQPYPQGRDKRKARLNYDLRERAFQDREIVYFLKQPETHSFFLYHDYTEKRPGVDRYLNIVRTGSKASDPSAMILDTGEKLKVETLKGQEITEKGIELSEVSNDTEVIVIWFDPVEKGKSTRLRISETYTDPNRYLLYQDELVWDRSFGRNRNAVVLPAGWSLTTSSIPAKISTNESGQTRLDFLNDRPDNIDVLIRARRKK
ncbi:MAG: hypothetical protein R8G66_24655 [Cytophagales bacterium]|nr:hypothetical protein [Cytophagales bacterium]